MARSLQDAELDDGGWFPNSSEENFDIDIEKEVDESDSGTDRQEVRMGEDADISVALNKDEEL